MKFSSMFLISITVKNNRSKVKNKAQKRLIKWDTQSSEELVLISCFFATLRKEYSYNQI